MISSRDYEKLYNDLSEGLEQMHRDNVRKTRTAIKGLFIVPTLFLVLIFLTENSKTTFLTLWLISFFVIAGILIVIEYQDYKLRRLMTSATGEDFDSDEEEEEEKPAEKPTRKRTKVVIPEATYDDEEEDEFAFYHTPSPAKKSKSKVR